MTVPVLINCRDRLESLLALLDYLERAGQDRIYLLDNDSAYPPLLDYFDKTPHHVIRLGRNLGHLAPWEGNVFAALGITGRFVFTDPDIVPSEDCPLDAVEYFSEVLDRYHDRDKVGFGLRIDDLPDGYRFKDEVVTWESQFWQRQLAPRLYDAAIDTTFALHQRPTEHFVGRSLRTGHPYVARHQPWYLLDPLPADEAFYRARADPDLNHWGRESLPDVLVQAIATLDASKRATTPPRLDPIELPATPTSLSTSGWQREPEPVDETNHTFGRDATIDAFHRLYYDSHDTTWKQTFWRGRTVRKCALDLWVYQEILEETRPDLIVETGTYMGGSALFLANVCDLIGHGKIVTIDVSAPEGRPRHRRITYLLGSSVAPEIVARVRRRASRPKRVMVVLDSDHRRDHVSRELELYAPLVTPGCYLVIEDTNVNGHPVLPEHGPGPMEAVTTFLEASDAFEVDRSREKLLLTFNPSGYLRRREPHSR